MKKIRSGLVGVAIIGSLVSHHGICRARAYRRRTLGLHFGCLSIVRGFNPESERGDRVPEIEKVATEPDLPTAFQPNLMLEPIPGVMI